jgi:hypothetical protein
LIELGESYAFTSEDRMALGVEAIRALLPARDSGDLPAVNGYLLARAWSGFDFGYIVGGDPETNTSAFARYHAWADKPELPPSMLEDGEPAESPAPQESADAGP